MSTTRTGQPSLEVLQKKLAYLCGGHDKKGGPILIVSSPGAGRHLKETLEYLAEIPTDSSRKHGFSVIIDGRKTDVLHLCGIIRLLESSINEDITHLLILNHVRSDRDKLNLKMERKGPKPDFVNMSRLHSIVDRNQLPGELGGSLEYQHGKWIHRRQVLEQFLQDAHRVNERLKIVSMATSGQQADDTLRSVAEQTLHKGKSLVHQFCSEAGFSSQPLDQLEHEIRRVLSHLEGALHSSRGLGIHAQVAGIETGIKKVVDWVLGPAEKLLSSHTDIGDSFITATELRKQHEHMEIKCTQTYGNYAELRHSVEVLPLRSDEITAQRDYMDTVCRNFASRLERRRNLLIASVMFHRLVDELSNLLDTLLELLCTDIVADTVEAAQKQLDNLTETCNKASQLMQQILDEGQSLLDQMAWQVKNAFGKDITPDYSKEKVHIQQILEQLQERRDRCEELSDVRRLKLQQILQLRTCERDANQAVDWILELGDVVAKNRTEMGKTPIEAENLQIEHAQFEQTAKGTYEYGQQLLEAGLILRRSLRYDPAPNQEIMQRLQEAWRLFTQGVGERSSRLNVATVFHKNVDKLLLEIDEVIIKLSATKSRLEAQRYTALKDTLAHDCQETKKMGEALIDRLSLPVVSQSSPSDNNNSQLETDRQACDIILMKLKTLDVKLHELLNFFGRVDQDDLHSRMKESLHILFDFQKYEEQKNLSIS